MNRRDALAGAFALTAWAAAAQGQRLPRIGVLLVTNSEPFSRTFRDAFRRRGLIEGRTVALEFRDAAGDPQRLRAMARDLAAAGVDVIVASQTPAILAARAATTTIPIVMAPGGDPVGSGIVSNLARPGGNITGVSSATAESAGKLVELIGEIAPGMRRIAMLTNDNDDFARSLRREIAAAGAALQVDVRDYSVSAATELEAAILALKADGRRAVIVQPSLAWPVIVSVCIRERLLAVAPSRPFIEAGGLMSYAGNSNDNYRLAAEYVDRILKGASPGDLPVQQPSRFELVLNMKTALAIGVEFSNSFVARADEVVE